MKGKQLDISLYSAPLLGCIFIFLKIFGKNEFAVQPLYQTEAPADTIGLRTCESFRI